MRRPAIKWEHPGEGRRRPAFGCQHPGEGRRNPPSDWNTLIERTHSNQHNDLGEVITPCRDNLMLVWMTYL
jgi:hypothetical protein